LDVHNPSSPSFLVGLERIIEMKKIWIIITSIIAIIAIYIFWNAFVIVSPIEKPTNGLLQECSRLNNIICADNYICYESTTKDLSGDKKCHAPCVTDADCPKKTPKCKLVDIFVEEGDLAYNLCF
jgi:hypothetical protein